MSEKIARLDKSVIDMVYPVGAIYMSVNSTNPGNLFGGKWEQIKDRFLLAAGDTYTAGSTGGEATHTLTINEMPVHDHIQMAQTNNLGLSTIVQKGTDGQGLSRGPSHVFQTDWIIDALPLKTLETGSGKPHNNMPPYMAIYMWKRTA